MEFNREINSLRERVSNLLTNTANHSVREEELLQESVQELTAALEELSVAEEQLRQQNEELAASHKRYVDLFEFAPDGYVVTDADGIIREANRSAAALFGVPQELLLRKPLVLFIAEADRKVFQANLSGLKKSDQLQIWNIGIQPRGREPFPAAIRATVAIDPYGTVTGLRWLIRDVTERNLAERALKEEKEKAQKYLDIAKVMLVHIGANQKVVLINKKGCEVLGYEQKDVIGKNWFDSFVPERMRGEVKALFERLMREQTPRGEWTYENPVLTRNGEERIIEWHNVEVTDGAGNIVGTLSSGQDITEHKKAEEALRRSEALYRGLSKSLNKEVKRKVAELRQAESLAAIGEMVSIVAHEVRNPLQVIRAGVDAIRGLIGQDPQKREVLEEILYGIDTLHREVSDLLDYARPVKLQYSDCSVHDIIDTSLKAVAHLSHDVRVHVDSEQEDGMIRVDKDMVGNAVVNLLTNAIEAMPNGGDIHIRSTCQEEDGMRVLMLSISDTGCGIDKKDLEKIELPFYTTKVHGTGLGLGASKKIIEAHKGSLRIRSKVNEGTTVEITLPMQNSDVEQKE